MFRRLFSTSGAKYAPRHLVSTVELSKEELRTLVEKAGKFKQIVRSGNGTPVEQHQKLMGKLVALLFSKRSTRTRILTEGAASFFGAQPMFLGKDDIQLGVNESIYDSVKVMLSMTSCIFARVNKHEEIMELCKHLNVPIINSLCDKYHPLQAITDILTIKESFGGKTQGLKLAWIGDANNVINDLAISCLKLGISVSVSIPKSVEFDPYIIAKAKEIVDQDNQVSFEVVNEPQTALTNANIIVTDTWISMGQELEKQEKLKQFEGYQITKQLIDQGNADPNWKFMHCLPRHPEEVDDEVFYSGNSLVFEEAENRLYAAMAVIDSLVVNKGDFSK